MIASVETDVFALDLAPAAKLGTKSKIAGEPNYIGIPIYKKGTLQNCKVPFWSGKRDSNSRPRPWQGRALPTELFPRWDYKGTNNFYVCKFFSLFLAFS